MELKYKRIIDELLEREDQLTEWERTALRDIAARDDKYPKKLSIKQGEMIDKIRYKVIEGGDPREYRSEQQTEYENCGLIRDGGAYYISYMGEKIPVETTKGEGVIILAWLAEAGQHLSGAQVTAPKQQEENVNEVLPF